MSLDLRQLDPACTGCIQDYKKKHPKGEIKGQFHIACNGIPKDYSRFHLPLLRGDSAELSSDIIFNPVAWAREVLDWHCLDPDGSVWRRKTQEGTLVAGIEPFDETRQEKGHIQRALEGRSPFNRPYQATMLECTASRKVFRIGRQCIEKTEFVYSSIGPLLAKDIKEGQQIFGGVCRGIHSFKDELIQVSFANGTRLRVNSEHPFFTRRGWIKAENLTLQDWVEFIKAPETQNQDLVAPEVAKLLGYLLSDGYWGNRQSVKFTNNNPLFIEEVRSIAQRHFNVPTSIRPKGKGWDLHLVNKHGTSSANPLNNLLKELGVWGKDTLGKILQFSPELIKQFVTAYFNGDGYIWSYKRPTRNGFRLEAGFAIGISRRKAYEFQWLLWKLGIGSVVKQEWMSKSTRPFYRAVVSRTEDLRLLLGFLEQTKYPEKFSLFQERLTQQNPAKAQHVVSTARGHEVKIKKLEHIGQGIVVGWETEGMHEIISYGGMRTHNSGKTEALSVSILYNMFTHTDFGVIVIAPYQSQIELVFRRLEELIKNSVSVANSIKRSVKAPNFTIELYNGSTVRGFTAGTRSAGNADAVRGQKANMLCFDECDYLAGADVASALAVITNQPDATVWMSSTPTGKRERFWEISQSKNWKEFHYSSHVNPNFTEELDAFYKETLTSLDYIHEVLAEFGEQQEGVYQAAFVDAAQEDYSYANMVREPDWTYCIGVDWNDVKIGTTIAVVGFNPKDGNYYLASRYTVGREGWTHTTACQKVAELNQIWRPAWIYVDKGFGGPQIEWLHKYGYDARVDPNKGPGHPDAALATVVVPYDFSGKVPITDPFTHQPSDKPAKPFLIENSMRRFEQNRIKFPREDKQLAGELLGYIVDRVTPAGLPVYKQGNEKLGDHNLDALNLALIAFTIKISDFGKPKYQAHIAFSGKFGEISEAERVKQMGLPGLVIQGKPKPTYIEEARKHQPEDRSPTTSKPILGPGTGIPAAHSKHDATVNLWAWDGFMRDEPPPTKRKQSYGLGRVQAPRRKNI